MASLEGDSVGIIGGGVGAMVAALLLARQGCRVSLFEEKETLGGRLCFFQHGDYRIDAGPTIVLLSQVHRNILHEAGIDESQYRILPCDPLCRIHFADGRHFDKYHCSERQSEEIARFSARDVDGFRRFLADGARDYQLGSAAFLERDFSHPGQFWTLSNLASLVRLQVHRTVRQKIQQYFSDPQIQDAFAFPILYIGGNPETAPSVYTLISYAEQTQGIGYWSGGYASLAALLEKRLRLAGVEIFLSCPVDAIEVREQRASALVTARGRVPCDSIVFNGDFPRLYDLLSPGLVRRRHFEPSSGSFLAYIGLKKNYRAHGSAVVHQYFLGSSMQQSMAEIFGQKTIPSDPSFYVFHPSILDDSLAPPGHGVLYLLAPVPASEDIGWASEKTAFLDKLLARIEASGVFPGLRQAIEWIHIRTPEDARADGLYQGGSFGIQPSLLQSAVWRPQARPFDIEALYAVGASVHPGGGVPIVMLGARNLVRLMAQRHGEDQSLSHP